MNQPMVSVLMTAYNREKYIGEAIESVLASTYKNWELIIVDDRSTDNTVTIANEYVLKDARIRVYLNDVNLGDYPNRNKAISYAKGEFIMFVDSDDKIYPNGVADCVTAMLKFPSASLGMFFLSKKGEIEFLSGDAAIRKHFFSEQFLIIGPGGTIFKRDFVNQLGGYPEKYGPANDMYFNLKAASKGGVVLLPFDFHYYRIHDGQEQNNKYSYIYNGFRYMKDALLELDLPLSMLEKQYFMNKNRRRFFVNLLHYFLRSKNLRKTIEAIRRADYKFFDFYKAIIHKNYIKV